MCASLFSSSCFLFRLDMCVFQQETSILIEWVAVDSATFVLEIRSNGFQ